MRNYADDDAESLAKRINDLEKKMYHHAENLEFEQAARLRDEVKRLREVGLKMQPAA